MYSVVPLVHELSYRGIYLCPVDRGANLLGHVANLTQQRNKQCEVFGVTKVGFGRLMLLFLDTQVKPPNCLLSVGIE